MLGSGRLVPAVTPALNRLGTRRRSAYRRESAYIAVRRTLHFQDADSLRPGSPRFEEFVAVRDRLDPDRRFTNRYLHRVLGS